MRIVTSFASLLNLPILLMGTIGFILLVVLLNQPRRTREPHYWAMNGLSVVVLFMGWIVISTLLRFFTYVGGTIEEIYFREALADAVAYALIVGFAFAFDKRRSSTW